MSFTLLHGSEVSEELLTMDYDTYSSELSELEISTLKQYQNIALNLIQLRDDIAKLIEEVNYSSTNELQVNGMINDDVDDEDRQGKKGNVLNGLLDELRMLENKMALVSNLFKSSVYQVVVTNSSNDDDAIVIGDELI